VLNLDDFEHAGGRRVIIRPVSQACRRRFPCRRRARPTTGNEGTAYAWIQLQLFALFGRFQPRKRLQRSLIPLGFVRPVTPKVAGPSRSRRFNLMT
jgi:hypothetical protein